MTGKTLKSFSGKNLTLMLLPTFIQFSKLLCLILIGHKLYGHSIS